MTIEEIQEMLKKLQTELQLKIEEKATAEQKAEEEKDKQLSQKSPAYAETRARIRQICKIYKITITEDEIKYITQPLYSVENTLKKRDSKYRYRPQTSAFFGEREPGQSNYKHNKKNDQVEMEIA